MNFNNIVFIIINNQNDPAISIKIDSAEFFSLLREKFLSLNYVKTSCSTHLCIFFFFFSYVVESRNVDRFEISSIRENFIYHYN